MELGLFQLAFLFAASVGTSFINAVAAVGGGMTLFAIMVSVLDYALVIPIHGIIQLWSSSSRVWFFRQHVNFRMVGIFLITYVPSCALGMYFWTLIIEYKGVQPYLKMMLGAYLVLVLGNWSFNIQTTDRKVLMLWAGAWSGILSLTAGSPAAVQAPLFIKANFYKEEFVGTWALSGIVIQMSKLPLFYFIWQAITMEHFWLVVLMAVGVVLGAYLGKMTIGRISESVFRKIMKFILLILASKLILWDGFRAILFT
jgi:uncharacterized membrane protein YfcA